MQLVIHLIHLNKYRYQNLKEEKSGMTKEAGRCVELWNELYDLLLSSPSSGIHQ